MVKLSSPVCLFGLFLTILLSPSLGFCQQTSSTAVTATPTTATVGQAVSISATVTGQNNTVPIPTGSVSFLDGSTSLGNVSLSSLAVTAPKFVTYEQLFNSPTGAAQYNIWSDLNGDGKPDLLTYNGSGVQVFLNKGNGTFTPLPLQLQSVSYQNLALIDFNGDGKIDILLFAIYTGVPPTNAGVLQVAYGNGDGTFQSPVSAPGLTLSATSLAVADLTGSGLPYILFGQNGGSASNASITVYKNNGNGSFTSLGNFPVSTPSVSGQTIRQILTVDLNGDGKLDLAVALQNGDYTTGNTFVAVLLNQGDGTFAAPAATLPGSNCANAYCASAVVGGDFGSRNKTDLAVLDNTGVELYPGNGDGTFATPVHTNILGGAGRLGSAGQLVAEDINGDGKLDLIECGGYAYLGNGDFTFTPTADLLVLGVNALPSTPPGASGLSVLVGDFDGDGISDLLFNYEGYMNHFDSIVQLGSRSSLAALPAITNFTGGVHPIVAKYTGDSKFTASNSPTVNVTVGKVATTISGTATPSPALTTQSIKLSVQVSATGPVPTGNVTFTEGSTVLGTAVLDAKGSGSISVTLGTAASHSVTLTYPGDAFTLPSTTSETVVTVANFPSSISLMTSPNPVVAGQPVILSAVVTPTGSSPIPTGNVVFLGGSTQLGSTPLDSSGKASFNTSFPVVGNQTITASYVGDAANQPSTASVVEAVLSAFDFQPTGGSSLVTVTHGSSATLPITVSSQNGFSGSVAFSCGNLPTGATCSFNPANVTVSSSTPGAVTLTISAASVVSSNSAVPFGNRQHIFEATAFFGCFLFLMPATHRGRRRVPALLCAALAVVAFSIAGCSGGTPAPAAPTTYTFNMIATSGAVQKTIPYSLVVQ
jgi:hypothetical protein